MGFIFKIGMVLLLFAVAIWLGILLIRKTGGRREMLCYAFLMVWVVYISISPLLSWPSFTTAELRSIIYSPVGSFVERLFNESP